MSRGPAAIALTVGILTLCTHASAQEVYWPGNGVSLPVMVHEVRRPYTPEALTAKVEGRVLLESVVLADGTIGDVRVLTSLDTAHGLDQRAVEAMKQWRFEPGKKEGKAVAVRIACEMQFTLK